MDLHKSEPPNEEISCSSPPMEKPTRVLETAAMISHMPVEAMKIIFVHQSTVQLFASSENQSTLPLETISSDLDLSSENRRNCCFITPSVVVGEPPSLLPPSESSKKVIEHGLNLSSLYLRVLSGQLMAIGQMTSPHWSCGRLCRNPRKAKLEGIK